MNRLASNGEIGEPWGVPVSRATRVPSGICIGALSHRSMHSRTHRSSVVVSDRLEEQIMRNAVEEGPDVKINSPVLFPAAPSGHGQRVVGATPRAVPVTVRVEDRF